MSSGVQDHFWTVIDLYGCRPSVAQELYVGVLEVLVDWMWSNQVISGISGSSLEKSVCCGALKHFGERTTQNFPSCKLGGGHGWRGLEPYLSVPLVFSHVCLMAQSQKQPEQPKQQARLRKSQHVSRCRFVWLISGLANSHGCFGSFASLFFQADWLMGGNRNCSLLWVLLSHHVKGKSTEGRKLQKLSHSVNSWCLQGALRLGFLPLELPPQDGRGWVASSASARPRALPCCTCT